MLQVSPTRNGDRTMQTTRKPMAWWARPCLRPWWVWWGMGRIVGVVCGCERWCRIDLNCQLQIFRAYCRQDRQGNRVCISLFWNVSSSVLLCVLPQITSRCLQFFSFFQFSPANQWSQMVSSKYWFSIWSIAEPWCRSMSYPMMPGTWWKETVVCSTGYTAYTFYRRTKFPQNI